MSEEPVTSKAELLPVAVSPELVPARVLLVSMTVWLSVENVATPLTALTETGSPVNVPDDEIETDPTKSRSRLSRATASCQLPDP